MAVEATDAIVGRHRATIAENVKLANEFFARHQSRFQWHPPQAGSVAFPRLLTGATVELLDITHSSGFQLVDRLTVLVHLRTPTAQC